MTCSQSAHLMAPMNGLIKVKSLWTSRAFVSLAKFCTFVLAQVLQFGFCFTVASEKHPSIDQNRSSNMQAKRTFQPTPNPMNPLAATIPEMQRAADRSDIQSDNSLFRRPFGEMERNSNAQPCVRGSYSEMPLKFMRTNNNEMIPNSSPNVAEKENVNYYGSSHAVFCASSTSDAFYFRPCAGNTVQTSAPQSNIKMRKKYSLKRTRDQLPVSHLDDIEEIICNKISTQNLLSHYLAPPKPDTPVQSVRSNTNVPEGGVIQNLNSKFAVDLQTVPFWLDPIWRSSPQGSNEPVSCKAF